MTVSADAFDRERKKISALSARERAVVRLTAEGRTNTQIAESLSVSEPSIEGALRSASKKLGISDRFELIVFCFRHNLVGSAPSRD